MTTPQTFDLAITGEMKGRNGYTRLSRVSVCTDHSGRTRIDFCSPRAGVIGAAAIELDADELRKLIQFLQRVQASL